MSSKNDYDNVVAKKAKRRQAVETIAAALQPESKSRRADMAIATSPQVNRAAAERELDEENMEYAMKRRGGVEAAPTSAKPYVSVEGAFSQKDRARISQSLNRRSR